MKESRDCEYFVLLKGLFRSNKIIDLSSQNFDSLNRSKFSKRYIYRLPFEFGRTIRGFGFVQNTSDPFMMATRKLVGEQASLSAFENIFYKQLRVESRQNCADFGLCLVSNAEHALKPAWCMTMPWEKDTFSKRMHEYGKRFAQNRRLHLMKFDTRDPNDSFYTKELAVSQALQTFKLLHEIQKNGLIERDPFPFVFLLKRGNKVRWIMSDEGNHRAHVCRALGYDTLVCRIRGVVERDELLKRPARHNVEYNVSNAIEIFDRAFFGNGPIRGLV